MPSFLFKVDQQNHAHCEQAHEVFDDLGHWMSPNVIRGVFAI
jgi:hypothetical protein